MANLLEQIRYNGPDHWWYLQLAENLFNSVRATGVQAKTTDKAEAANVPVLKTHRKFDELLPSPSIRRLGYIK